MEFGTFTRFYVREGCSEHDAFAEWIELGVDCFWLGSFIFGR